MLLVRTLNVSSHLDWSLRYYRLMQQLQLLRNPWTFPVEKAAYFWHNLPKPANEIGNMMCAIRNSAGQILLKERSWPNRSNTEQRGVLSTLIRTVRTAVLIKYKTANKICQRTLLAAVTLFTVYRTLRSLSSYSPN